MKRGETNWPIIAIGIFAIAILAGVVSISQNGIQFNTQSTGGNPPSQGSQTSQAGVGYATAISAGAINALSGAAQGGVNANAFAADNSWASGEVNITTNPTAVSTTAPNSLVGYLMIGNDGNQGTDRGGDYYYRKIPISYSGKGTFIVADPTGSPNVRVYAESTPTWTGYDDGAVETTTNISVATSATVTNAELRFAAGAAGDLGNPEFDRPLGVCFNTTVLAKIDTVRPANYIGTFTPCKSYQGLSFVGSCYILDTPAVQDYGAYRFPLVIKAVTGQDPVSADSISAVLMDKTYFLDDMGVWQSGFCDDSAIGTSYDPGIDGLGNAKVVYTG